MGEWTEKMRYVCTIEHQVALRKRTFRIYNTDEPAEHRAERRKPDTERQPRVISLRDEIWKSETRRSVSRRGGRGWARNGGRGGEAQGPG